MSIYIAIIVRQYAEGRICITTDRIGSYLSNEGGSSSLWKKLLEWIGQKKSFETISVGVINNRNIPYKSKLEELIPISIQEITLNDITHKDLSEYDLLYFIGLPSQSSENLERVIEGYVKNGGGVYIEVPDRTGEIEILKNIESVNCSSINRSEFNNAYWTYVGQSHYIYTSPVNVGFHTTLEPSGFSSEWQILMSNEYLNVPPGLGSIVPTNFGIGSEFGIGYTIAMQKGIVEIKADLSSFSSSSFDSSSSSSSSSTEEPESWDFCSNVLAYWKMDENVDSPVVWDQTRDLQHMGILQSGSTPIYTSSRHVTGIINGALSFNGSNDKIVTGSNLTLNFNGPSSDLPFSISFWIYPQLSWGHILCKSEVWEVVLWGSILYVTMYSSSGYRTYYMSGTSIPLNTWSNITIAYDGTFGGMFMYYNGRLKSNSSSQSSYITMNAFNTPLYFASNVSTNYFNGYIDNVYILDKKVDEIEIEVLWNIGRGCSTCRGTYIYSSSSSSSIDSSSSSSTSSPSSSTSSSSSSTSSSSSIDSSSSSSTSSSSSS